jgi:acetyltransferase-like isoleucine patch superfamily enzyme
MPDLYVIRRHGAMADFHWRSSEGNTGSSNREVKEMKDFLYYFIGMIKWNFLRLVGGNILAARAQGVTIGKDCRIYTRQFGGEPWLVTIGDHVDVSTNVEFNTHDGTGWLISDERGRRHHYAPITVGNNVYIGSHTIILPGVTIGNNVIIGAGSLVNQSIPDNCVVTGSPIKYRISFEDFKQWALARHASDADMVGKTRRERVDSIVDHHPLPSIKLPQPKATESTVHLQEDPS